MSTLGYINALLKKNEEDISRRRSEAAAPGFVPPELQKAYRDENPDSEKTFFEWLDVASPEPQRSPSGWDEDVEALTKDIAPGLPKNEASRPNVRETIKRLRELAGPLREHRDAYNKKLMERDRLLESKDAKEPSPLPKVEAGRPNVRRERDKLVYDMPPLLVEGDVYKGVPDFGPRLSRIEPFDTESLNLKEPKAEPKKPRKPTVWPPKMGQFTDQIHMPGVGDIPDPGQFKWGDLWNRIKKGADKITPDWDNETSANLGKGLAALGDAFMAGGGMKSSFYNNIVKGERLREKQPWERFQTFSKLLNTRVQMDMNNLYKQGMMGLNKKRLEQSADQFDKTMEDKKEARKGQMALALQNIGIKKQQLADNAFNKHLMYTQTETMNEAKLKDYKKSWEKDWYDRQNDLKGTPLVGIELEKMKFDTENEYYPKWITDQYKKNPEQIKKMYSVNDLKRLVDRYQKRSLKKLTAKEATTIGQEMASLKGDTEAVAIMEKVYKKPVDQITKAEFKDFKNKELPRYKRSINEFIKVNRPPLARAKEFIKNTQSVLKLIGTQIGEPSISRDQIQIDVGNGQIWFTPKNARGSLDPSGRREIDLDSLTLPVVGDISVVRDYATGLQGKRSTGALLAAMYEASYGPKRRESFGASQSWMEMERYKINIGEGLPANQQEAGKLQYILNLGDEAQTSLSKFAKELEGMPGGAYHINKENLRNRTFRDLETKKYIDLYVEPVMAHEFAEKALRDAQEREGDVDTHMPHWWRSFKERIESKHAESQKMDSEKGRFFHYDINKDGRESRHPDRGTFTPLRHGTGAPPSRWTPEVYLQYIKTYGLNDKGW